MLAILGIVFPIFAAIGLGYVTVWRGLFTQSDLRVLGKFVLNIALPALMFNAVTKAPLGDTIKPTYLLVYLLAGLATVLIAWLWFCLRPTGPARRAIAVMGMACPNSGYMGLPVLLLALPQVATEAITMNFIVENFVILPLCFILVEFARPSEGKAFLPVLGRILLGVLSRPMVIGLILGFAISATGLALPEPLTRLTAILGNATAALALFVIGGSLVGLPVKGNLSLPAQVVIGKLVLHPMMAFVFIALLAGLGFSLPPEFRAAMILSAAMPMMGIYAIIAQDYGHEGMASVALLGATVAAAFTLSGLLYVLL